MNYLYYKNKEYNIILCNNYIRSGNKIHAIVGASLSEFTDGEIIMKYSDKFYKSSDFSPHKASIGGNGFNRVEVRIDNLVEITRDFKIDLIINLS